MDKSSRKQGYVFYGKPSLLSDAVGAVWELFGFQKMPSAQASEARLVLLDHTSVKDPIAPHDIEPFRTSLGGGAPKVVRIRSAPALQSPPEWMLESNFSHIDCLPMLEWIGGGEEHA